jgi:hypothetical protein
MLSRIFPRQIDNAFRGHRLGVWLFAPVVALKLVIGVNSILHTRDVAMGADGIPLDRLGAGADEVLSLFALLSLSNLMLALLGALATIRYRAMIPLLYLLFLLQQLGGKVLMAMHPVARAGAATLGGLSIGTIVTYGLLAATAVGFVLSLIPTGKET